MHFLPHCVHLLKRERTSPVDDILRRKSNDARFLPEEERVRGNPVRLTRRILYLSYGLKGRPGISTGRRDSTLRCIRVCIDMWLWYLLAKLRRSVVVYRVQLREWQCTYVRFYIIIRRSITCGLTRVCIFDLILNYTCKLIHSAHWFINSIHCSAE